MLSVRFAATASCQGQFVRVFADGLVVEFLPPAALIAAQLLAEANPEALLLFGGGDVPIDAADGRVLARVITNTAADVIRLFEEPSPELQSLLARTKIAVLPGLPSGPVQ